ncbi:MAG TPA: ATP-binding protein [bacterium]|jgi:signal transduction histidine kinase
MASTKDGDASTMRRYASSTVDIFIFVALAVIVSGVGVYIYVFERDHFRSAAGDRLAAIGQWQLHEIEGWRTERLRDATQFTTSPYNAARMVRFLGSPPGKDSGDDLLAFLNDAKGKVLYHDLVLADTNGNVRIATYGASKSLSDEEESDMALAIRSGSAYLADIRRGDVAGSLHLNVYAPLWDRRATTGDSVIVGTLILELDPATYLYPLIENWPTPTETGESVLVRRDGDEVVYLSRLRFRNYSPLMLRFPVTEDSRVASVMAGNGVTGIVMARDYRDTAVMSALYRVPHSPWILITKIDESEIVAPLKVVAALITGITASLILLIGASMLWWWKRSEAKVLRVHYDAERDQRTLLERIAVERRRAEEQLQLYNEQLEKAVEERSARIRTLERDRLEDERQVALGRMAARVAHEINNPLAGIKNAFTLVKRAIPTEHRHYEFVGLVERELERIARIVRQMFELYRQHREKISIACPADVVREVSLLLAGNAQSRQVTVDVETGGTTQPILLHEDSLRQALFAVIQNGIEASPPGGRVRVKTVTSDDKLEVTVADQGPGIPEGYRTRIFEPFFTTKEGLATGGLGLGLSVTRGLLENLGGTLTFESCPGQGTTFTISMPLRISTVEASNG